MTAMQQDGAFARRLQRVLDKHGMSQSGLARAMSVDLGYVPYSLVRKYLRAEVWPSYVSLVSIKEAVGCTWEELMEA